DHHVAAKPGWERFERVASNLDLSNRAEIAQIDQTDCRATLRLDVSHAAARGTSEPSGLSGAQTGDGDFFDRLATRHVDDAYSIRAFGGDVEKRSIGAKHEIVDPGKLCYPGYDPIAHQFDEGHASGRKVGSRDHISVGASNQPPRREVQVDGDPAAIRQVDDRHDSCNPVDCHKLASRLRHHDLFANKTSVERAHHSIAVLFNDGDNRVIAARDEDVARHGAKIRFDLRGSRTGLTE